MTTWSVRGSDHRLHLWSRNDDVYIEKETKSTWTQVDKTQGTGINHSLQNLVQQKVIRQGGSGDQWRKADRIR